MTKQEQQDQYRMVQRLEELGLNYETIQTLRRISMTLRRWFELGCGDSDSHKSWAIERDEESGLPYMVIHPHNAPNWPKTMRNRIADKESGARKRLAAIMAQHPALIAYIQTDPRGCALHILHKPGLHDGAEDLAKWAEQNYSTRGIAVW